MIIPFLKPSTGPNNEKESQHFRELSKIPGEATCAVGWAISLRKQLMNDGATKILGPVVQRVE